MRNKELLGPCKIENVNCWKTESWLASSCAGEEQKLQTSAELLSCADKVPIGNIATAVGGAYDVLDREMSVGGTLAAANRE